MGKYHVHIDRFSAGLDELTRKQQKDISCVLKVLDATGRFSVFEATENQHIAKTMDLVMKQKLVWVDREKSNYPWTYVTLTDAGRAVLASR